MHHLPAKYLCLIIEQCPHSFQYSIIQTIFILIMSNMAQRFIKFTEENFVTHNTCLPNACLILIKGKNTSKHIWKEVKVKVSAQNIRKNPHTGWYEKTPWYTSSSYTELSSAYPWQKHMFLFSRLLLNCKTRFRAFEKK